MYEIFTAAFITLFVVIDPIGIAPVFAVMTEGTKASYRRKMIFNAMITSVIILNIFAIGGEKILSSLGISMGAFRTAGGFMLFLIAMEMVFEKRQERRDSKAEIIMEDSATEKEEEKQSEREPEDISVFPIAIPFIAGPGSIAAIILLMNEHVGNIAAQGVIIAALVAVLILTVILLFGASRMMAVLGPTITGAITRILGVLLAALATQFMFDGIRAVFITV
jgi:multiple antibiotic resistance protein